jgi:hypothetical protein
MATPAAATLEHAQLAFRALRFNSAVSIDAARDLLVAAEAQGASESDLAAMRRALNAAGNAERVARAAEQQLLQVGAAPGEVVCGSASASARTSSEPAASIFSEPTAPTSSEPAARTPPEPAAPTSSEPAAPTSSEPTARTSEAVMRLLRFTLSRNDRPLLLASLPDRLVFLADGSNQHEMVYPWEPASPPLPTLAVPLGLVEGQPAFAVARMMDADNFLAELYVVSPSMPAKTLGKVYTVLSISRGFRGSFFLVTLGGIYIGIAEEPFRRSAPTVDPPAGTLFRDAWWIEEDCIVAIVVPSHVPNFFGETRGPPPSAPKVVVFRFGDHGWERDYSAGKIATTSTEIVRLGSTQRLFGVLEADPLLATAPSLVFRDAALRTVEVGPRRSATTTQLQSFPFGYAVAYEEGDELKIYYETPSGHYDRAKLVRSPLGSGSACLPAATFHSNSVSSLFSPTTAPRRAYFLETRPDIAGRTLQLIEGGSRGSLGCQIPADAPVRVGVDSMRA